MAQSDPTDTAALAAAVKENLHAIEETSAVAVLTGLTPAEIDDLGGLPAQDA